MKQTLLKGAIALAGLLAGAPCAVGAAWSGTLPVVHIQTEGGAPIVSKDDYINATCHIDPLATGMDAYGSEAEPMSIEIRGRGNYTWTGFDKKPYKIKLGKKAGLLGMEKNKHYTLLAHADDYCAYMRNIVGFETSRRMGLAWTPTEQPVEVVLNGDYIGLYFLTENVRVDSSRVDITEQADLETDPEQVAGGWLVEIDNYPYDPHVEIYENGHHLTYFTYKTPEVLSPEQERWLKAQMQAIDDVLYQTPEDSREWETLIDPESAVRYYIVQEVMDDCESYHGSCYLYHDLGEDTWKFGPVWDFGNSFQRDQKNWIYRGGMFWQTWIGQLATKTSFQERVREAWREFAQEHWAGLDGYIDTRAAGIREAARCDASRWPQYSAGQFEHGLQLAHERLRGSVSWLGQKLGTNVQMPLTGMTVYLRGDFNNWDITYPMTEVEPGVYTIENVDIEGRFKIATSDWSTVDYGGDGSKLIFGEPYHLVKQGANIGSDTELRNVNVRADLNNELLTITSPSTVIGGVAEPVKSVTGVFNLQGQRVDAGQMPAGVYIVRYSDGTSAKVLK